LLPCLSSHWLPQGRRDSAIAVQLKYYEWWLQGGPRWWEWTSQSYKWFQWELNNIVSSDIFGASLIKLTHQYSKVICCSFLLDLKDPVFRELSAINLNWVALCWKQLFITAAVVEWYVAVIKGCPSYKRIFSNCVQYLAEFTKDRIKGLICIIRSA